MSGPLFLGFDLSTQQLKAAIIDEKGNLVHESAVHFDRDLSEFGTTNGALAGELPGEVYCPVIVWIEAVDLLMTRLKDANVQFAQIVAISGAAQVRKKTIVNHFLIKNAISNMAQSTGMLQHHRYYHH